MPEQATKPAARLETELLQQLQHSGIEKDRLRELVTAVVGIHSKLGGIRVFPRGLPAPDSLTLRAILTAPDIKELLDELLHKKLVGGIVVFPYGVLQTEAFQIDVSIGGIPVAGGIGLQAGG
jgi:hypothetical protein